jgi:hypothetical protein
MLLPLNTVLALEETKAGTLTPDPFGEGHLSVGQRLEDVSVNGDHPARYSEQSAPAFRPRKVHRDRAALDSVGLERAIFVHHVSIADRPVAATHALTML